MHKDIALHFVEGWQLSQFSSSCGEPSNILLLSLILSPTSLNCFPLMCWKKTMSLTWRFIPPALSATQWRRDHSTVFHLTRFRTASTLTAAGSGEVTGYCMEIPTVFPVQFQHTFLWCFSIPGRIFALVLWNQLPLEYNCLSHLDQCQMTWLKKRIISKIKILKGTRLEKEWWMDRQVGKVSHRGSIWRRARIF